MNTYIRKIQAKLTQLFHVYHFLFMPLSLICSLVVLVCLLVFLSQELLITYEEKHDDDIVIEKDMAATDEPRQEVSNMVYVDVSGGVVSPGVMKVLEASRISDVVLQAGGFSDNADLSKVSKSINLAKKISDGDKIVIPILGQENETKEEQVNINDATILQLQTLKGVGQVRAEDIISNRPYSSIEELVDRNVLPLTVFEGIKTKLEL